MARTRSKPAPKETPTEPTTSHVKSLPPSVENPPKIFVLPTDTSRDSRIVTLDNPANDTPSRYLYCPKKGFYEFTRIAAPKKTPRSWLLTSEESLNDGKVVEQKEAEGQESMKLGTGYITKGADLFIATPIDLLFLILPALAPKSRKEEKQHFLCLDDHLDILSTSSRQLKALLSQYPSLKIMIEKKMSMFCDTVDAGDETMYRLSTTKLHQVLLRKAERMCKHGLPASMEDKFIKPALEIPIMNIKRDESTISVAPTIDTVVMEDSQESTPSTNGTTDSQTTTGSQSTAATSFSSTTDEPSKPALTTPPEVPHLLRLRTSLTYLLRAYIPPSLRPLLTSLSSATFAPLDTHLAALAAMRSEAAALRSISDNISQKRGYEEDEEKVAEREEKRRKKEEEEKRRKGESRAVKQLKKADTTGMKKLSAFFAKAPVKKVG